jgi:conjugal transfer mating pair stabilization protein TraN
MRDLGSQSEMKCFSRIVFTLLVIGNCTVFAADCARTGSICVDTTPSKSISGVTVTIDQVGGCWAFEDTYQCKSGTISSTCDYFENKGCKLLSSTCTAKAADGSCDSLDKRYECQTGGGITSTITNCDGQKFCVDGNCFDTSYKPDPNFAKAAAIMMGVTEAGKDFDPASTVIFNGQNATCRSTPADILKCCGSSPTGVLPFYGCNQAEKELAIKRGNGQCHDIGSYCNRRFLGVCLDRRESYCCFTSKLSRIINVGGHSQVGRGWGSPEGPDCTGFTANDLQKLDFSKLDLSEFYADIVSKAPNQSAVKDKNNDLVKKKTQSYFGR